MRLITKLAEPHALKKYRESGGTWNNFSRAKGKLKVELSLLREQHNLCAYCTRRISLETMHIEHWKPRVKCNEREKLTYSNMFAVCGGWSGDFRHCDVSKEDQPIAINPLNGVHVNKTIYSEGSISSVNPAHAIDLETKLCLNAAPLVKLRREVLNTLRSILAKKYPGRRANFIRELTILEGQQPKPFDTVLAKYLRSRVG